MKVIVIPNIIGALGNLLRIGKETGGLENKCTSGDQQDY